MRTFSTFVAGSMVAFLTACGTGETQTNASLTTTTTTTPSATTTTTTSAVKVKAAAPFSASVHDVLTQLNLQLPILVSDEASTPLPVAVLEDGVFGGRVTSRAEVYLKSTANAFSPLLFAAVRVTGSNGSVQTPARLLSGVGVSLYALSPDVADAFRQYALPRLSAVSQNRTTITVWTYYDLTVVVVDQSTLVFLYTPVGVAPPVGAEAVGA